MAEEETDCLSIRANNALEVESEVRHIMQDGQALFMYSEEQKIQKIRLLPKKVLSHLVLDI